MTNNTPNLKHYKTVSDFAADLNISESAIFKMKREGVIPADAFTKSGRNLYVKVSVAKDSMKNAPIGSRGRVPTWAAAVGNKVGIAKAKELAKKEAGVNKPAKRGSKMSSEAVAA